MILKKYNPTQKLSRITKLGPGYEVLHYSEFFVKLFSDDFIAVPDAADIKKFDSEKVIKWTTELKGAKPVDSITSSIKGKLESEKAKLADKIKKLKGELESPLVENKKEKEQELHIYEAFSFDWDSPDPEDIYMADNKLVILNWGLCDPEGVTIIISNGGDPGPPLEDEDEPQPEPTKTPWYYWLIVPLLLLILLLLKNCAPYAEITFNHSESDILFESHKSHDHNNFFSSGILKETKATDLERQWTVFQNRNLIIDSSWIEMKKSDSDTIRIQKYGDGIFWIKLTIKDTGNKFGFWNKSAKDNLLYVVRSDTIIYEKRFRLQDVDDDSLKFIFIDPETGDPIDTDRDGVPDNKDDFPYDPDETKDEDHDGLGSSADPDDNDPNNPTQTTGGPDSDGDGVPDSKDKFPTDPHESTDEDNDGFGSNSDPDDNDPTNPPLLGKVDTDGDGVPDSKDKFPTDPKESSDEDNDGFGSNSDPDDNDPNNPRLMKPVGEIKEIVLRKKIVKPLPGGWKRVTVVSRVDENHKWHTENFWFVDPNGSSRKELPNKIKAGIDQESI